jgi:thiamine biosynthesis lipoprotein
MGHDLHRVEHVMGTAISLHARDVPDPSIAEAVFESLRQAEARFSPYRSQSEISRLQRGELAEAEASADVRHVLALCDDLSRTTSGYFDARHHRADGLPDPTGLVKGWAVEEAALLLEVSGVRHYALNAGGDVIVRGEPEPGRPWRIGLRHPDRPDLLTGVVSLTRGAVATSGAYERGEHIRDPHTGRAPRSMRSVTVVGPSLTYADAYATAAFAMGLPGLDWVAARPGYGVYACTVDGQAVWSRSLDGCLA